MAQNATAKPIETPLPVTPRVADNQTVLNDYSEVSAVVSGSEVDILTYTVPSGSTLYLFGTEAGGENIATYRTKLNGVTIAKKRTYFAGPFHVEHSFKAKDGLIVSASDVIKVTVEHDRSEAGDFEARIIGVLQT